MEGNTPALTRRQENDHRTAPEPPEREFPGLEARLRRQWGALYGIGYAGGCWLAIRLDAGNDAVPLCGPSLAGLAGAIAADWAAGSTP